MEGCLNILPLGGDKADNWVVLLCYSAWAALLYLHSALIAFSPRLKLKQEEHGLSPHPAL